MSKTKKILLLLSTIISVSISAVSIYYLNLYYKFNQSSYVNLSDEKEKQLIYLKNSFNEFIFKKIQNNFNKYQKEYFMSTYWVNQDTLESSDQLDSHIQKAEPNTDEEKNKIRENIDKYSDFLNKNKEIPRTLTLKTEFDNLDSNIVKPVFEKYLTKFFPNQSVEQVLQTYNLYYFVKNSSFSNFTLSSSRMGWWNLDFLKDKKIYFVNYYPWLQESRDTNNGATISIIAFKKEDNIVFNNETDWKTLLQEWKGLPWDKKTNEN